MLFKDQEKSNEKKSAKEKDSVLIKKGYSYDQEQQQTKFALVKNSLEKLLNQSALKQQKYVQYLQKQRQNLYQVVEKYSQSLKIYKKQIKQFIQKKQAMRNMKKFEKVHRMISKVPTNKLDKIQYTVESQYELKCRITFNYFIAVVQDYLKQVFPSQVIIQFMQYYPQRQLKKYEVQLGAGIDQQQKLQTLRNGDPFQISTKDKRRLQYNFILSHFNEKFDGRKILKYYKQNQLQIMLKDQGSQLIIGQGKLDLQQFLQFNVDNQENWIQKIPIMSIENSNKTVGFMMLQMSNFGVSKTQPKQHIHKISEPISIKRNEIKFYNDKQSRIIQRINQYKNSHNNIIPSNTRQITDKNIMMHQKRKELEQIELYKQANKSQYMQKIFEQAIEQYHTQILEVGECKYIPFIYTNHTDRHQRVKIRLIFNQIRSNLSNQTNQNLSQVERSQVDEHSVNFQIVDPTTVQILIQERIIQTTQKVQNCTKDYTIEDGYTFIVNGQSIVIYVKAVCHILSTIDDKYQVTISLSNDYGQNLHTDMMILKASEPVPKQIFPIYTCVGQLNLKKIQIPSFVSNRAQSTQISRAKIANFIGNTQLFQITNYWSESYEILQLEIKTSPKARANKTYKFYVLVYDIHYTILLATYQFVLQTMDKIEEQNIQIGRTNQFSFKIKLPLTQEQTTAANQKMLVHLGSSDYLGSCSRVYSAENNSREMIVAKNVQYPIIVNYNTFVQTPQTQKLVVSFVDYTTKKVLKKLALPIKKNSKPCKRFELRCPQGEIYKFNLQIKCDHADNTAYKFYSSNNSLMGIPIDTVTLNASQRYNVKLEFNYWAKTINNQFQDYNNIRFVYLGVDDGKNCSLYLFQLNPDVN